MATKHITHYIADHTGLESLCTQLREAERIAIDTEFVGEDNYVPRLELIQIATHSVAAVLDFPALHAKGPLDNFWELLCRPTLEKVLHAGRQDLELFATYAGQVPKPFFDTQIAAAMAGHGAQVAYAHLVQRVSGTRLDKAHTFTNWSQRPLTKEQITYALEDVQYLLAVHDHLRGKLTSLGRLDWVQEEFDRLESVLGSGTREPQERYQRIRGWESLKPKTAAVLRALAAWREGEAKRKNVPRGRVLRDEVVLQLARQAPKTINELRGVRGLHPSEIDRNGATILDVIQKALALPPSEWPEIPRDKRPEPESTGLVELLQAVLKTRAAEADIAPTLLATTADLQALVDAKEQRITLELPILRGWRREIAGETLLQVLEGKTTVSVDPRSGKMSLKSHH